MSAVNYAKHERISLKGSPELNEKWLEDRIAEDPGILGLGDLVLKDRQVGQPGAGRLDLLLQDPESYQRYEVEIQLGRTDESHIIRTIEYWDIERRRYQQYDHTAVIVAEDITSRFLNVISLLNRSIPLIAMQVSAIKLGDQVTLVFTRVLDLMALGTEEEEEEAADRAYWEKRATPETVALADELLALVNAFAPGFELKYNKFYIGLAKGGRPDNFGIFVPQKNVIRMEVRLDRSDETDQKLASAGLDVMGYDGMWGRYRMRLTKQEIRKHAELIKGLLEQARGVPAG